MDHPPPRPPPQGDDPIITQFRRVRNQWELTEDNIKRIDRQTGETILHNYCRDIHTTPLAVYRYLIETKSCGVNIQDKHGYTPLHRAFENFDPDDGDELGESIAVLRYLLSQCNVEADIKNKHDYTFLHTACKYIKYFPLDVFKLLIETHGFDVNVQDYGSGYTPLQYAFHEFNPKYGGDITVLMYLLSQCDFESNREHGLDLLHRACNNINDFPLDVFKVLIKTIGCDINAKDDYNGIPLDSAFECFNPNDGDINVLLYLLSQKNIDADIKNDKGQTLLHTACGDINTLPLDVFKVLIEAHGFDVNEQDNDKNTPIHRALEYFNPSQGGDINVLAYLINQKGVNVSTKYKKGYTLLHTTCIINLSRTWHSAGLNAKCDAIVCQVVDLIAERCLELLLDETTP
jgi:ankyrin repeat protein